METRVNQKSATGMLTPKELAKWVLDGYLELPHLVPQSLNEQVHKDAKDSPQDAKWTGLELDLFWDSSEAVREVHKLPEFQRILNGLMGADHTKNHSWLHITPAGQEVSQTWHVDQDKSQVQLIDNKPWKYDLLTLYFPHDVPREMGPTLILPGSHLRSVSGRDLSRYRNFRGQKHLSGPGGRIIFTHSLAWHCAQPNHSDTARYMFKIRYDRGKMQTGLLGDQDISGIDDYFRKNTFRHPWIDEVDTNAGRVQETWNNLR
tara:strand:+ start:2809 stop:3591 length:783 start_codon:yes stop_codon:yes gene_type:complete